MTTFVVVALIATSALATTLIAALGALLIIISVGIFPTTHTFFVGQLVTAFIVVTLIATSTLSSTLIATLGVLLVVIFVGVFPTTFAVFLREVAAAALIVVILCHENPPVGCNHMDLQAIWNVLLVSKQTSKGLKKTIKNEELNIWESCSGFLFQCQFNTKNS